MKKIWPFSFYFLYFGATAWLMPYLILYYQSLGFSGTQIGLLSGLSPLISLVGAPFWTGIADTMRRHRMVMGFALLASIGLILAYPFAKGIAVVFTLVMMFSFMSAPVASLADSATMSMLGEDGDQYGRVRVGGTIGWGVFAPITGVVIERSGLNWAFWAYAALMFIAFLVSRKFIFTHTKQETSFRNGLRELFSNRKLVLFLSAAFVCGMALMSINAFLLAYMEQLGISRTMMGMALAIATFAELPVLFFSGSLLAKIKPRGMLILSMVALILRLFLYATFTSTAGILIFQVINGFTFATLWVAGVSYANENAPAGLSATAQGVFGAMIFGFGAAGGGFIGALLLERFGGATMYAVFGSMLVLTLIAYLLIEGRLTNPQQT